MRIIYILSIILLLFISSISGNNSSDNNNKYTINGTITDPQANGKRVYIRDLNTNLYIDSMTVEDGKFTFKGSYDSPTMFNIIIRDPYYVASDILAENAVVTVELAEQSVVTSNGFNGEVNEIRALEFITMKVAQTLFANNEEEDAIKMIMSILFHHKKDSSIKLSPEDASIVDVYLKDVIAADKMRQTILKLNSDNILGVYCLYWIFDMYEDGPEGLSIEQANSLLNQVPIAQRFSPVMKSYSTLKTVNSMGVGAKFVDFSGENIDGSSAKLSDYVGKGEYVLVDFWASWCIPCTQEIPYLKYLHENYPELVVLGVNVWDGKERFHKYVKERDIKWSMLYASDNRTATELYGVTAIPTIILFDPQGVIVDRTLRREGLKKKIAEIFDSSSVKSGKK